MARSANRIFDPRGVPSREEQLELVRRYQAGDESARDELITRNAGLVATIAGLRGGNADFQEDLRQEGVFGLMKAVERFDPSRGVTFSTYASYWIRQAIKAYLLDRSKLVREPRYLAAKWARGHRYAELAKRTRRPVESLDVTGEGGGPTRLELLPSREADPCESVDDADAIGRALRLVDGLLDVDRDVIRSRFGLDGRERETLREIGERRGITRERVRQIEGRAIKTLQEQIGA